MPNKTYQPITSRENQQIKLLEKLQVKKYREEFGQFVVENLVIIADALKEKHDFDALLVTEEFADKNRKVLEFLEKNSRAENYYLVKDTLNKQYSSLSTPSGIAAVYQIRTKELDQNSVVYLNGINDPGNLGAIMRSALAFGFLNLVLDGTCVDIYNPKVINAAKDSIFKLNIFEDRTGEWLEKNRLPIYATSSHEGQALAEFKPADKFLLVLGSESHGVEAEIMKRAEQKLRIEINPQIESLNVAAAAAILFYELRQK